jgi:class 3 adenylate cyclase
MVNAQQVLADQSRGDSTLYLKVGINIGPCIAVTLNERLDYFGGTINMAARLESLSTGHDVIISDSVREDLEVQELLNSGNERFAAMPFSVKLKGFEDDNFNLWRVSVQGAANNKHQ